MSRAEPRVLVIDDDAYARDRISDILVSAGYAVELVGNPSDGYERCAKAPARYGLVFMDVHFPQGPVGYELARDISRFRDSGGPAVIGMTGFAKLYDYEKRHDYGMADVIMKPLHENLILMLTEQHFARPA